MPKPNLKGMGSNQRQVFNLLRDNPGYYIQVVLVDYPLQELITFLDEDGDDIPEIVEKFSVKGIQDFKKRNLLHCFQQLRMSVSTTFIKYKLKPDLDEDKRLPWDKK